MPGLLRDCESMCKIEVKAKAKVKVEAEVEHPAISRHFYF